MHCFCTRLAASASSPDDLYAAIPYHVSAKTLHILLPPPHASILHSPHAASPSCFLQRLQHQALHRLSLPASAPLLHTHSLTGPCCTCCSTFDDPGLLSGMLPWRLFWQEGQEHRIRWSLCAKEICFKNELLRWGAAGMTRLRPELACLVRGWRMWWRRYMALAAACRRSTCCRSTTMLCVLQPVAASIAPCLRLSVHSHCSLLSKQGRPLPAQRDSWLSTERWSPARLPGHST